MNTLFALEEYDPYFEESSVDLEGDRIALHQRRVQLEEEIEKIKVQVAALDRQILEEWERNETSHVKRAGSILHMHSQRYATVLDEERLHDALTAAGLGSIVKPTVNKMTLTATLKELEDTAQIPPVLDGIVELRRMTVLRQRAAR